MRLPQPLREERRAQIGKGGFDPLTRRETVDPDLEVSVMGFAPALPRGTQARGDSRRRIG